MSAAPAPELPEKILDQAIGWLVRMQSGNVSDQTRSACARWRQADLLHEAAWQALQASERDFQRIGGLQGICGEVAIDTLERLQSARHSRRNALKLLGLGTMAGAMGGWGLNERPLSTWGADYVTGVGERRPFNLSDGTRLQLNTASAVDVQFSAQRRLINLRRGEIFIDTGNDAASPTGRREFWVHSPHARLQALGTAFAVRQLPHASRLRVEQHAVVIHSHAQQIRVEAGEEYLITAEGCRKVEGNPMHSSAWTQGQLVARRMRLRDLAAELARYRHGWLSCDPQIAELHVSGVFQLDDIDQALSAVADHLPVRIERFTSLWSRIVAR
ncbi:FecR domain-containing protein [Pseudomonas fontis]|uniref:FecR family protein n=1 Tax=Pseudomonas fontis TaxID=2942633 RepID=A0ABT5NU44_9PSED|nr:FecR family protein [Pseudomonas fontis]MDD0972991.1 FecR family protein [Pseudomonas fontis]MDD0991677.1 FecR family protein [Pseudomonas fontis]